MPISTAELIIALVVTFGAAAVQGTIGIGFAVVSVPILRAVSPLLAPVPQLLVTIPLTVSMFWRERHDVDLKGTGWIIAGRIPGLLIGIALLKTAQSSGLETQLDVLIALLVLVAVALIASNLTLSQTPVVKFGAGTASGIMALVASIGGPPIALLYRDERGPTIRSTLAAVFTVGVLLTLIGRILSNEISGTDVQVALMIFPATVLGFLASHRLRRHAEGDRIRIAILVISTVAAGALILRSVF